jgi:hypothetical protein
VPWNRYRSWFNTGLGCRLLALLTSVAGGYTHLFAQTGDGNTPVPIQRIVIPSERVAKELEKAQQGTLLLMPQPDFEARLERVRQAVQTREQKPHLTQARYSAELVGRSFANGSGQWTIQNTGTAPSILPIIPLNLALAKVKWEQGGDAILAECDGKSLGLLVSHAGNATCLFDWSARGTPTNEAITFNLTVPPCPISIFEFKLPTNYWLAVPKGTAVVTGPHEAESASKRLWKVQVTESKAIDLLVRKIAEVNDPAPTLFARVHSTQKLKPERFDVEHVFQLDILHGSVRELILEGDAALQPYHVLVANSEVKNWRWKEIAAKKDAKGKPSAASGLLTIQFDHPVQGRIQGLRVRSLAARSASAVWTSPALRVRDALPRGETLEIHLHPDLSVGKWEHGSFRPTHISTESDGTQILTLAQTAADAASARRPVLMAPVQDIDLHSTENYLWKINPRGATLAAEIHFALARGNLFQLRIRLPKTPPGYRIETLELQPAGMLEGWHPVNDSLAVVDLKQALTPGKKASLKIQLHSGFREIATGRDLPFPELEINATKREGTLAIQIDPIFRAQLMNSSVPLAPVEEVDRDQGMFLPSYRFTFRDQLPSAVVRLVPQPVQAQLAGTHTITLSELGAELRFRWDVQPLVGAPAFLDFRFAPGITSSWKVKEEDGALRIHHWERLYLQEALPHLLQLGCPHGLQAVALESILPTGAYWRFHLAEPLRKKSSFTLEAVGAGLSQRLPNGAGAKVWSVPLMTPVQRSNVNQELDVESPGEPIDKVAVDGSLQRHPEAPQPERASERVRLRQAAGSLFEPATKIKLWTRPEKRSRSELELCDEARLTTYVHKDGRIYHRIQFRLWHWHNRACELQFPPGFQVLAVKLDDRWLQRLALAESRKSVRLTLPFDQNAEYVRYEILARWEPEGFFLPSLRQINIPRIDWPIAPIDLRTRFFLENGVLPLHQELLSPVGVPGRIAGQSDTPRRLQQIWNWGQSWWPYGEHAALLEKMENQKQSVLREEANLRGGAKKTMKLSEALERFALEHLKDQAPLVIDRVAMRWLGLSSETTVSHSGRPDWETLGLVYVPCPSGALLTSPRRLQSLGINGPWQATELDEAVQEAILHGRDASSGFFLVVAWLRLPSPEGDVFASEARFPVAERSVDFQEMSEWEIGAAGMRLDSFYVIEPMVARILGWLLAILAGLVLWRIQRALSSLACLRVYVLILTVSMLIVFWSPLNLREFYVLPTFLVEIACFLWCVARVVGRGGEPAPGGDSTLTHPTTTAAALGLLLLGVTWSVTEPERSWAKAPAPRAYTVLVIGGAKPAVLVTPDLIAKLDELENQAGPGAVLVSAKYVGKTRGAQVKFDVQYEIYSFSEKANLIIPLTGVQLNEGAFLDGAPVLPVPHKSGYLLPIQGKGTHNLQLSFAVRLSSENDQFNLRFTIPKLIQNEITLQWPAPVQTVHCLHCWGREKTLTDTRQAVKEWHAQLGHENIVHLRWTNAVAIPSPKEITVKEAHFWDLRPASLTLISSLNYSIRKGSLAQLVVAVPEGLHVRAVEALTVSPQAVPATPIVVKHWQMDAQRRLLVNFEQPVTGQVTLNLEMVPPAFGQKSSVLLPLPAPLQGESGTGLLGYRLDAAEIRRSAQNLVAVLSINAEDFEQQWKKQNAPSLPPGAPVSRAYRFQRKATKAWLELITRPNAWQATGQLQWNLDHHKADLQGKFTITSPMEDLFFLEFYIDKSMTLADVAGPDVSRWQLHESRLQVWLRQPRKETTIKMIGWRSVPAHVAAAPKKSFVLPGIYLYSLETQLGAVTVEIRPASGIHLEMERSLNLRTNGAGRFHFTIEKAPYEASFRLNYETKLPEVSMLTKVHGTDQGMEIWHGIRLTTQRGQLPNLKLHLKDWPHQALLLDAPGAIVQRIQGKSINHPAWALKYPSGLPQEVFITLRGRVAMDKHASIPLPVVQLEEAAVRFHWLAWKDVEIERADSGKKLTPEKSVKDAIALYKSDRWFQDMSSWNIGKMERFVKAVLPKTSAGVSARVLASADNARLGGERRWLHEARFWIHAPEATQLRVKFPAALEAMSAWTDGRLRSVLNSTAQEFVLPLEPTPEPRLVELRWQYTENADRVDTPSLAAVQLDEIPLPAHIRIVWVPRGMFAAKANTKPAPTLLPRLVHEAEGFMQIAASLAQEPARSADITTLVSARQQNSYLCMRQAEYALSILKNARPDFDQTNWLDRLRALKRKNFELTKQREHDELPKTTVPAGRLLYSTEPSEEPVPAGLPMILTPNLSSLPLQSDQTRTVSARRTRSELFLLVAVFLLVSSYFRHGRSMVRLATPEITIALAATAIGFYGPSLIGIILISAMVIVRSLWIAAALKNRFARSASEMKESKPPSNLQQPPAPAS